MKLFNKTWKLAIAGAIVGVLQHCLHSSETRQTWQFVWHVLSVTQPEH